MKKSTKTAEKSCSTKASSTKMSKAKASSAKNYSTKTTDCAGSKKCGRSSSTRAK